MVTVNKEASSGNQELEINILRPLMLVDPCIIVQFVKKNPTRCNNVSKFYYSICIWSSTCFGRHSAHHQEPKTALAASRWIFLYELYLDRLHIHHQTLMCWVMQLCTATMYVNIRQRHHSSTSYDTVTPKQRILTQFSNSDHLRKLLSVHNSCCSPNIDRYVWRNYTL